MARYAHSQKITVYRRGGVDRFGDPLPGTQHDIDDVVIYPTETASSENSNTNVVTTGRTLLPPDGADIRPTDRIRLPGDEPTAGGADPYESAPWAVEGDPGEYQNPMTGWRPGGIVRVERVH